MNILIAYDGSDCATSAVDGLRRAGLASDARAIVLSVADVWLPPLETENKESASAHRPAGVERAYIQSVQALAAAREFSESGAARLREIFPHWEVQAEAVADSPAWATIKRATEWPAELVVVGSHGHSSLGRFMLGDVSQKVVAEAPCSVRVGRRDRRPADAPVRILVGLDGSADADAAVTAVGARVWPAGTEIRLMTSIDAKILTSVQLPAASIARWAAGGAEDPEAWVSRMIAQAAESLRAHGLRVSSLVKQGDPKNALLSEADKWDADAIFVGARGHRLLARLLLGSVSASIAARAHCSIEIVRERATESEHSA